jgi:hypothetical protein
MSNTVMDTLNELQSQATGQLRSKALASSNNVTEQEVWSTYHGAVAAIRRVWGEPELGPTGGAYEGPGWRAGYHLNCPSPNDGFRQLYCQALRIGWWKREGCIYAIMVTGHDASTLQMLQLAIAEDTVTEA